MGPFRKIKFIIRNGSVLRPSGPGITSRSIRLHGKLAQPSGAEFRLWAKFGEGCRLPDHTGHVPGLDIDGVRAALRAGSPRNCLV
jgi:hypothetical protein